MNGNISIGRVSSGDTDNNRMRLTVEFDGKAIVAEMTLEDFTYAITGRYSPIQIVKTKGL